MESFFIALQYICNYMLCYHTSQIISYISRNLNKLGIKELNFVDSNLLKNTHGMPILISEFSSVSGENWLLGFILVDF